MSRHELTRTALLLALFGAYGLTFVRGSAPGDRSMRADPLAPQVRAIERALTSGRYSDALALARDARRAFPRDPFILLLLAQIHHGLGQPDDEASAWDEYMAASETPAEACPAVSDAYERLGDTGRALERLRRCAVLEPDDPGRLVDLAESYERAGRADDALEAYRRAHALDPADPDAAAKARLAGSPGDRP